MTNTRKVAELGLMVVLVVVSLWAGRAVGSVFIAEERGPYVAPPLAAPDSIPAMSSGGETVTIELASRARPLVVFALAVDCPFCRQNLPYWREIAAELEAGGETSAELLILSLSPADATAAYLAESGLPYDFVVVSNDDIAPLDLPGVPATVAISPGSAPMRRWAGVFNDAERDVFFAWMRETAEKSAAY